MLPLVRPVGGNLAAPWSRRGDSAGTSARGSWVVHPPWSFDVDFNKTFKGRGLTIQMGGFV